MNLADWQSQLEAADDELQEMLGTVNFNVSSFSVDQKVNYEKLMQQKAHCEDMLHRLGGGTAATANATVVQAEDAY